MSRDTNRRTFLKAAGVAGLTGLAGCSGGGDGGQNKAKGDGNSGQTATTRAGKSGSDVFKLGAAFPMSGEYGFLGQNSLPVVKMMAEQINNNGGLDGTKIKVISGDTEAKPEAAKSLTNKLVKVNEVDAIVGYTSLVIMQLVDTLQANKVPTLVTLATTSDLVPVGGDYIFRLYPGDELSGIAMALSAVTDKYNTKSYKNTVAMASTQGLYQTFLKPLKKTVPELGGNIDVVEFAPGQGSYDAEVSKAMDKNPDAIFLLTGPDDGVKIQKAAYQQGYNGQWIVTEDQIHESYLKKAPKEVTEGIIGPQAISPQYVSEDRLNQLKKQIKDYTGKEAGLGWRGQVDAMNALTMSALKAASNDNLARETIAKGLPEVARPPGAKVTSYEQAAPKITGGSDVDYQGIVSNMNWDKNGNVSSPYGVKKVKDQKWTKIGTIPAKEIKQYISG